MLFNIKNNYGHACDDLDERLSGFQYHRVDNDTVTIELDSIEQLNKLAKTLGKILVKENNIIYFVD